MEIVNCTPHVLRLVNPNTGEVEEFPPSGSLARVSQMPPQPAEAVGGYPTVEAPQWGEVEGLPEPDGDKVYVVSGLTAAHCGERDDVFSPGTSSEHNPVRDDAGRIYAVRVLVRAPR
jgi:hypothetical protein